jgi:cell division protein FtsB
MFMKKGLFTTVCTIIILLPIHLVGQSTQDTTSDSVTISQLQLEVSKLGNEVEQLKKEIQQLKHLLEDQPEGTAYSKPQNQSDSTSPTEKENTGYRCSKSGNKRHNPSCRYYKSSNVRPCGPHDGIPCKLCGG